MENSGTDRIRQHIELYQSRQDTGSVLAKQERLRTIKKHIDELMKIDSKAAQNGDFDEQFESLHAEMYKIIDELAKMERIKPKTERTNYVEEMTIVINGLKKHPVEYNDFALRQPIEYVKVMSEELIYIYFKNRTKIKANIV